MKLSGLIRRMYYAYPLTEWLRRELKGDLRDAVNHLDKSFFLNSESIAIDCGANIGNLTSIFRRFGAKVFAFEPNPVAFKFLQKRFRYVQDVHLFNEAVSDKNGEMELYFHKLNAKDCITYSQGSSLISTKSNIDASNHTTVQVKRLVDFLLPMERIDLLKIYIEGSEYAVLKDLIENNLFDRIGLAIIETHHHKIPSLKESYEEIVKLVQERKIANKIYMGRW